MTTSQPRIYHDGTSAFLRVELDPTEPDGRAPHEYDLTAHVRIEVPAGCVRASVVTYPDAEERHDSLERVAGGEIETWSGSFRWRSGEFCRYRFKIQLPDDAAGGQTYPEWFHGSLVPSGGRRVWWLTQAGLTSFPPPRETDYAFSRDEPPEWVKSSVFYQIFPDRFFDGDPSSNVRSGEYDYHGRPVRAKAWGELPEAPFGGIEFYGGDLPGVSTQLDYLQVLGVNALYLNPIFSAPSVHRYDTQDYRSVDPHLGGAGAFRKLAADLHARGMRVILDGVFNHTGVTHDWFQAAVAGTGAATRSYYTFPGSNAGEYLTWLGVKTLPKLDYASAEVKRVIYEGDDSIVRHWLRPSHAEGNDGADGWRLDVVHMMGEHGTNGGNARVLAGLRRAMHAEKADSYLVGEHFYDATAWLQGDLEDAAMNYQGFTWPTWGFLAGTDHRGEPMSLDAAEYDAALRSARARIPWKNQLAQLNLLNSHDTPRLISLLPDERLTLVAAVLLFTAVGAPCVYYGDEIGLHGGQDPDSRRTMPWDKTLWNHELKALYQDLARLRRSTLALQEGGWETLYAGGDVLAFQRRLGAERVVVGVNRGNVDWNTPVSLDGLVDWRQGHNVVGDGAELSVPARGFRILHTQGRG